jgi:hypothetical protein
MHPFRAVGEEGGMDEQKCELRKAMGSNNNHNKKDKYKSDESTPKPIYKATNKQATIPFEKEEEDIMNVIK